MPHSYAATIGRTLHDHSIHHNDKVPCCRRLKRRERKSYKRKPLNKVGASLASSPTASASPAPPWYIRNTAGPNPAFKIAPIVGSQSGVGWKRVYTFVSISCSKCSYPLGVTHPIECYNVASRPRRALHNDVLWPDVGTQRARGNMKMWSRCATPALTVRHSSLAPHSSRKTAT